MDKEIISKGIYYLKPGNEIQLSEFDWNGNKYPVGSKFEQLGVKERTMLKFPRELVYAGLYDDHCLFSIEGIPGEGWYIAPARVNDTTLLMQASDIGFWEIRA